MLQLIQYKKELDKQKTRLLLLNDPNSNKLKTFLTYPVSKQTYSLSLTHKQTHNADIVEMGEI